MAIEDRSKVVAGANLVARYKDTLYKASVVEVDGKLRIQVDGHDEPFSSLSTAAIAVAPEAKAINGWRFWSMEGELSEKKTRAAKADASGDGSTPTTKRAPSSAKPTKPNITKMRKQTIEGQVGFFCSACQDGFYIPEGTPAPQECPQGHPRKMADDLAPVDAPAASDEPEAETNPLDELFATPAE